MEGGPLKTADRPAEVLGVGDALLCFDKFDKCIDLVPNILYLKPMRERVTRFV